MYIKLFSQLSKRDAAIAGGKGASLGEMSRAGLPVPPGFVIVAEAFKDFTSNLRRKSAAELGSEISSLLKTVNYKDTNSIDRISHAIRDVMERTPIQAEISDEVVASFKQLGSRFVAVRSSATAEDSSIASWAGELETYLNTTSATLLENVRRCWSSIYTPRAIFYRHEKRLHEQEVFVAVVIQAMVESEVSGIAFTVHPVTKDRDQMIIEAGYGLGEAIVSGQVTPDSYIVNKKTLRIEDVNISKQERMIVRKGASGITWKPVPAAQRNKRKLTEQRVIRLAALCRKIEQHYRKPQDIEWAYTKGKFYITQSRPITTL